MVFDLGGMGMGWRELGFPGERVSVALVIAGSEEYGFVNSLQLNNIAWMRSMYDVIKDRQLRHVVVPGSHDAGLSRISDSGWFGLGTASNTETQSLDHYNQLRVGVRYFDMRIVSINWGDFWAAHVNDETAAAPVGATGESLDDLIKGVNRFMSDFPGEVVVWYIRYMTDLDDKKTSSKDQRFWDAAKAQEFYTKLEQVTNRCVGLTNSPKFDKQPHQDLHGCQPEQGMRPHPDRREAEGRPPRGPYLVGHLPRTDIFGPRRLLGRGAAYPAERRQAGRPAAGSHARQGRQRRLLHHAVAVHPVLHRCHDPPPTIQLIANQETNPALYHYGFNKVSPEHFPTVILHDAVGLFHISDLDQSNYNPMVQTLAIGLNLYMVSQNCKVSKNKNPLLKKKDAEALWKLGRVPDLQRSHIRQRHHS